MKTIIEVWGSSEKGKSQGIKAAALSFPFTSIVCPWGKNEKGDDLYDNYMIGYYTTDDGRNTTVGFENQGDPGSNQAAWIQHCIDKGCEVIVCACRTWGETRDYIRETAQKQGCQLIEVTTPFHYNGKKVLPNSVNLVDFFAKGLNDLVIACLSE